MKCRENPNCYSKANFSLKPNNYCHHRPRFHDCPQLNQTQLSLLDQHQHPNQSRASYLNHCGYRPQLQMMTNKNNYKFSCHSLQHDASVPNGNCQYHGIKDKMELDADGTVRHLNSTQRIKLNEDLAIVETNVNVLNDLLAEFRPDTVSQDDLSLLRVRLYI